MKRLLLIFAVSLCAAAHALADWNGTKYASLTNAVESERYADAYAEAMALHVEGDTIGTYTVAAMKICGDGCERDYLSAIDILIPLATTGDERAQYMIGAFASLKQFQEAVKEFGGDGVEVNDNAFWFQMMSKGKKSENFQGVFNWLCSPLSDDAWRDIMYSAGMACLSGAFGESEIESGLKWLHRSAEKGYIPAIELLNTLLPDE